MFCCNNPYPYYLNICRYTNIAFRTGISPVHLRSASIGNHTTASAARQKLAQLRLYLRLCNMLTQQNGFWAIELVQEMIKTLGECCSLLYISNHPLQILGYTHMLREVALFSLPIANPYGQQLLWCSSCTLQPAPQSAAS